MKRLLLLSTLIVTLAFSAFKVSASTRLHIASYDNAPIVVYIDGVEYGPFSNRHKLSGLAPGMHNLRVLALYTNPYSAYNTQQLIYNGPVSLPFGYEVVTTVTPYNNLNIDQMYAMGPEVVNVGGGVVCAYPGNAAVGHPVNNPVGNPVYNPVPQAPVIYPMHEGEFTNLMGVINNRPFDSTKRQLAAQALSSNYFTSGQILRMLQLFSFESSRLEVAKLAYSRTVDPERFYIVFDAFTFDSSVRNLSNYMASL
ncbi:hypothetical protein BH09BAC1_BH09BAC1_19920 [soil metagenome]